MSNITVSFTTTSGVSYPCSSTTYNPLTNTAASSGNWLYYLIYYDVYNPTININLDMDEASNCVFNFLLMGSCGLGGTSAVTSAGTSYGGGGGGGTGNIMLSQATFNGSWATAIIPVTLSNDAQTICTISNYNGETIVTAETGYSGSPSTVSSVDPSTGLIEVSGGNGGNGGDGGSITPGSTNVSITGSSIYGGGGGGGGGSNIIYGTVYDGTPGKPGTTSTGAFVTFADGLTQTFYGGLGGSLGNSGTSGPTACMMLYYNNT